MSDVMGADAVADAFDDAARRVRPRTDAELEDAADEIAGLAFATVARDSGATADSIESTREGDCDWSVGPTWFVGEYLEEGTSKMAAQPFLFPAADAVLPRMYGRLTRIASDI